MYVHLNIIYKELFECAVITAYMKACGNHRIYKITVRTVSNCGDDRNLFHRRMMISFASLLQNVVLNAV